MKQITPLVFIVLFIMALYSGYKIGINKLVPIIIEDKIELKIEVNEEENKMPLNYKQLDWFIREVLKDMETRNDVKVLSDSAVELIKMTIAREAEVNGVTCIKQLKGPARGVIQIEPATENEVLDNPKLRRYIVPYMTINRRFDTIGNLAYQIALARCNYLRFSEPLPSHNDIEGLAGYYKKYWNSYLGASTVEDTIEAYNRYCKESS